MAKPVKCPKCGSVLEKRNSDVVYTSGDFFGEMGLQVCIALVAGFVGAICFRWSEALGYFLVLAAICIFYVSRYRARVVRQCTVCGEKYVGKSLKPYASF